MSPTDGNHALLVAYDRVSRDLGYGPVRPFDPGRRGAVDISFAVRAAHDQGVECHFQP